MQSRANAGPAGRGLCPGRRRRPAAAATLLLLLLAAAALLAPAAAEPKEEEGELELEYAAVKNANGEPAGTPTKRTIAGRTVYYEVPQARSTLLLRWPRAPPAGGPQLLAGRGAQAGRSVAWVARRPCSPALAAPAGPPPCPAGPQGHGRLLPRLQPQRL